MNKLKIVPTRYNVLIEVDKIEAMEGSIHKTDQTIEKQQYAHNIGTLREVGEMAFKDWTGDSPQVGEKVLFDMYKGVMMPYNETVVDILPNGNERERTETSFFRVCLDTEILGRVLEVGDGS